MVHLSQLYVTTGKSIALTLWTFVGKLMFLLFSMMSRIVIDFLPRGKRLLISWLQSPSAVILEPKEIKSVTVSIVSLFFANEVMELDAMIFLFCMLSVKPAFSLCSFTFIKRLFSFSLPLVWYHLHIWGYWYFSPWKWKSLSCVRLFVTPWTLQSMEFSRPEYWSG